MMAVFEPKAELSAHPPLTPDAPLVFLIAGEPSGDMLGAHLMAALRQKTNGHIRFAGVGGEAMAAEGLDSLVDISELAVMGFLEVLPKARRILSLVKMVAGACKESQPAALVSIDSWGFTGRVHKLLQQQGADFPRLHYVAPMVWAWKERRAETVAKSVDHLLALLPQEPALFERHGLSVSFVGHPVIEGGADRGDAKAFRQKLGIADETPLLCMLPGSRRMEVDRLLPEMKIAAVRLQAHYPGLEVVVPTVATVAQRVRQYTSDWPLKVHVVQGTEARHDAFAAAFAAIAASGTVALELARANIPHVSCYKVSAVTAFIYRRLRKTTYANLVNILQNAYVVPELLQEDCTGENLAAALQDLLNSPKALNAQQQGMAEALGKLSGGKFSGTNLSGKGGGTPSEQAANVVMALMKKD